MLHACLPWQHAERDEGYYTRTRHALRWPGWYTWKYDCLGMDGYLPMLWRVEHGPAMTAAIALAQRMRGHTWLMGNEPERPQQANTPPALFADAMRTWLALVGGRWAGPGILWSDGGRDWLDAYLALGGPIPDVWAVHIYGSETVSGWLGQYEHLQAWLATRRIVRPVWITETNARGDATGNATLMLFLAASPDLTAFWYASRDPFGDNAVADLHDAAGRPTALGQLFADLQRSASGAGTPRPRREHSVHFPFLPG